MKKPTQVRTTKWNIKQGFVASIAATMNILLFFHVRTNADDMPALQLITIDDYMQCPASVVKKSHPGAGNRTGGAENYSVEQTRGAELVMADPSGEDEPAFPWYFEEAYAAEDVTASSTAPAAAHSGSAPAEVRGPTDSVDGSVRLLWPAAPSTRSHKRSTCTAIQETQIRGGPTKPTYC